MSLANLRTSLFTSGLGCAFLTEQCTNKSVFPYLCDPETELVCTYDHLTKVRIHSVIYYLKNSLIVYIRRAIVLLNGVVLMVALLQLLLKLNTIVELK